LACNKGDDDRIYPLAGKFAARYREKGYWQDLPLTNLITRHAESDAGDYRRR
jgi:non-ribosomal peptide synthetase component E (peptide arylation enzyme)